MAAVPITRRMLRRVDSAFFVLAGVLVLWVAYLTLRVGIEPGWQMLLILVFWAIVAYLALPRAHRILTSIYVPDYFIGRTRTSDGLLGDPVNLALMGTADQIHRAMTAAGWIRADDLTQRTGGRIVSTTLARRSYPEAPVSPLFLFRRRQDFAYQQEVAGSPSKRHHVRFWKCPDGWLLPGGTGVDWLAAGTYDRSVGLSLFTLQVTHKISADVDAERDHIIETVTGAHAEVAVRVLPDFFTGYHSRNGGGDVIQTDGDLPIVDVRAIPVATAAAVEPVAESRRRTRPPQITFGVVMTALRGLSYLALAAVVWSSPGSLTDGDSSSDLIAIALLAGLATIDLGLAGGVYRGWNWARLLVCASSLFSAGSVFIARLDSSEGSTQLDDLLSVGISVLVLLALSSEAARRFSIRQSGIPEE
ncbi:MAG TPA: LssY C-terminal domain-containing protein [Micropruina sp.]|nr:LssY C-terminal domain-containing protein [Micropruina sp.]